MTNRIFTGKRTGVLIDILVTENTPEAIAGSKLRSKRRRCFEEEANIGEFVFEAREEGGKGLFVLREILVAKTLVMIYFANLSDSVIIILSLPFPSPLSLLSQFPQRLFLFIQDKNLFI